MTSSPPPFRPLTLQPTPKYFQIHLPGTPWYYFHEFLQSWMPNRAAKESAVAFDLAFEHGKLTLGGAEISLDPTEQWTEFRNQKPKGIHRMAVPINSLTCYIGGANRLPGRRVFADAVYKIAAFTDAMYVTVKVRCITGAGEADYEGDYGEDYTMTDDGDTRAERSFMIKLEATEQKGWTVVGAEGVEFQGQEVDEEVV